MANNTDKAMKDQVAERVRAEAEDLKKKGKACGGSSPEKIAPPAEKEPKITSEFIHECLFKNELGDGLLYAALHREKFIFVPEKGWFFWNGVNWESDIFDRSIAAVDNVVKIYLSEAAKISAEIQGILSTNSGI